MHSTLNRKNAEKMCNACVLPIPLSVDITALPAYSMNTAALLQIATGIRSPDRPARSQSLYRLRYPSPVPGWSHSSFQHKRQIEQTGTNKTSRFSTQPATRLSYLSLQYSAHSSLTEDTLELSAFFHYQVHIGFHQTPQGCVTTVRLHVALRPMNWERPVRLQMPSTTTPHTSGNVQVPIILNFAPIDFHFCGSLKT
jgi:hypothetical protein